MSGMSGMSGAGSESSVPVSDRGLQYGDGLFETIACRDGRPRFLARHFERLMIGCARLGIPPPSRVELEAAVAAAAARAAAPRSLVKVLLTRGSGPTRGYAPPLAPEPRCIVEGFVAFEYEITLLTVRHRDGTSFCEPLILLSTSSRSSGTVTMPLFGSMVQNR